MATLVHAGEDHGAPDWFLLRALHSSHLCLQLRIGASSLRENAKTYKEFVKGAWRVAARRYHAIVPEGIRVSGQDALRTAPNETSLLLARSLMPERVMVCMSSARHAPRVIRAGARFAGRLGAGCYAVYVETPHEAPEHIRASDLETLQRNIALAQELGVAVVRVKADRAADGLIAFAKREGIAHVIFGQTARSRWQRLLKGSTLDRFCKEVLDATVQVVPLGHDAADDVASDSFLRLS